MSATVEREVVPVGDDSYVEEAWTLKERVRNEEGFLRQRRGFFQRAYGRTRVHTYRAGDELVGFAAARRDGYILFLAVADEYRGEGYGERLVAAVADECGTVSCHARTTNERALGFYDHLGFERVRRIDNYYEDGGAAFYLRLGDEDRLLDRLSRVFRS